MITRTKIIAAAIAGLAVIGLCMGWSITATKLKHLRAWQASVISSTSQAAHVADKAGRPALLAAKDVTAQIVALGAALDKVEAAGIAAKAAIAENNSRIGAAQAEAGKVTTNEIESQLVAARASAAEYARRLREQSACAANRSAAGQAGTSTAPGSAALPDGPGRLPIMDERDLQICTDNTVKALGWKSFQSRIDAIPQ